MQPDGMFQPGTPQGPAPTQQAPAPYGQAPIQLPKKGFDMLIVPLVLLVLSTIGLAILSFWLYGERDTYKNKTDEVVEKAVELAVTDAETKKDNQFLEDEKKPLQPYKGPASFGTVAFEYPKTWSAQISDAGGNPPVNGFLHPDYVPALDDKTSFALRFDVLESLYSSELKKYDSDIKKGTVTVVPFTLEKVPGTVGVRVTGQISNKKTGVMIMLPLRDKTIRFWTEGTSFTKDFDEHILKTLTFVE